MRNEIHGSGLDELAELVYGLQSRSLAYSVRVDGRAWVVTVTGF